LIVLTNVTILIVLASGVVSAGIVILAMDRVIQLVYIFPFPLSLGIRTATLDDIHSSSLSYLILVYILVN